MKIKLIPAMVLSVVAMPIVAVIVLTARGSFKVNELRIHGEVPEFQLTDRSGKSVTLDSLRGKVWVGNFIFTACTSQCPLITMEAKKISKALLFKDRFQMVSVTIDPMTDTPERLAEYAKKWEADPFKWYFLTGPYADVKKWIQEGLKVPSEVEGADLMHSSKLVLVDHMARIRGYYDAEDSRQMSALLKDAKTLIKKAF